MTARRRDDVLGDALTPELRATRATAVPIALRHPLPVEVIVVWSDGQTDSARRMTNRVGDLTMGHLTGIDADHRFEEVSRLVVATYTVMGIESGTQKARFAPATLDVELTIDPDGPVMLTFRDAPGPGRPTLDRRLRGSDSWSDLFEDLTERAPTDLTRSAHRAGMSEPKALPASVLIDAQEDVSPPIVAVFVGREALDAGTGPCFVPELLVESSIVELKATP